MKFGFYSECWVCEVTDSVAEQISFFMSLNKRLVVRNFDGIFIALIKSEAFSSLSPFAPDAASVASSIKYHSEYTPLFSPEKFELPKAFFATAQSVRDALIINWNATYEYYNRLNVKQAYYLSMEFLQVCFDTPTFFLFESQQSCIWLLSDHLPL